MPECAGEVRDDGCAGAAVVPIKAAVSNERFTPAMQASHPRLRWARISPRSGFFGDIQSVEIIVVAEFFAVHEDTATPSSSRRLCNAVRTQVLMVPRGCPILTAISVCDKPSK